METKRGWKWNYAWKLALVKTYPILQKGLEIKMAMNWKTSTRGVNPILHILMEYDACWKLDAIYSDTLPSARKATEKVWQEIRRKLYTKIWKGSMCICVCIFNFQLLSILYFTGLWLVRNRYMRIDPTSGNTTATCLL